MWALYRTNRKAYRISSNKYSNVARKIKRVTCQRFSIELCYVTIEGDHRVDKLKLRWELIYGEATKLQNNEIQV
jgi:hypothetical protein